MNENVEYQVLKLEYYVTTYISDDNFIHLKIKQKIMFGLINLYIIIFTDICSTN